MTRAAWYWMDHAKRVAASTYDITIDDVVKRKDLVKFGRNNNMTASARETLWDTGVANETYVADNGGNPIDRISSSNSGDTQATIVEGHYQDGAGLKYFVVLAVTLTGQTPVDLANATVLVDEQGDFAGGLARCSRIYNNSGTNYAGDIYVYQSGITVTAGVPQDLTKTHAKVIGTSGLNQSNKAASTISNSDAYIIHAVEFGVGRQAAAFVDFALEIKLLGKVFRESIIGIATRDSGSIEVNEEPLIIVPPNADFRVVGTSSANSTTGFAVVHGVLCSVVG